MTAITPSTVTIDQHIASVLSQAQWNTTAEFQQPSRGQVTAPIPANLHPELAARLQMQYPDGLYRHQAMAIEHAVQGLDVALTTPTSSGKSLVFMTSALQILLADPTARIVALYPMKALSNDQFGKWQANLASSGFKVAVLDGDVPMKERSQLLAEHHVLLMTPDVLHTWCMANLHQSSIRAFRNQLRLVILDEAHVYDGVFGTGTACLLRRLEACGPQFQLIASSATIGEVDSFLTQLTGRSLTVVSAEHDGSPRHEVHWRKINAGTANAFTARVSLMKSIAQEGVRFIAFADSRKSAELHAAAARRGEMTLDPEDETFAEATELLAAPGILPYRSGFETSDRQKIEQALSSGELRGVIATSALELGVDIPGIHCVILLGSPTSQKSLWQRAGRTGRNCPGSILYIDDSGAITGGSAGLAAHLQRPIEPNHLSLDNRMLEFIHVLCAASEATACGEAWSSSPFVTMSARFHALLEGERAGGQMLDQELFELKTKGGDNPHRAFSLRSGKESNFEIFAQGQKLGTISFPQILREAYPGAVYYHLATPYRVRSVKRTNATIEVTREKHYTTTPVMQSMVFVKLNQAESVRSGESGFLYSGDLQVTERVTGFREKRGSATHSEVYGTYSTYAQRPFDRWLRSTGVCWTLQSTTPMPEATGERILNAYCNRFGVCRGDLGLGKFQCQQNPYGPSPVTGYCIYDRIEGGLRLTDELSRHFSSVVNGAHEQALNDGADPAVINCLRTLAETSAAWNQQGITGLESDAHTTQDGCIEVIQPGSPALLIHNDHHEEITILNFNFTTEGVEYMARLAGGGFKTLKARFVHGIDGLTIFMQVPQSLLAESLHAA